MISPGMKQGTSGIPPGRRRLTEEPLPYNNIFYRYV